MIVPQRIGSLPAVGLLTNRVEEWVRNSIGHLRGVGSVDQTRSNIQVLEIEDLKFVSGLSPGYLCPP